MKTVRDACELQPNALDIKLSDQVEQIDDLINAEGKGEAFFERTFITHGMKTLVTEGIARLAGKSSQAIFHLKQAMGGGKTHLLIGLGLLARYPELRSKYCADIAHIHGFETAKVAAFNGRNQPDEYFWGFIAKQIGKGEQFARYWVSGPDAPDERAWLQLFSGNEPILILLDEMPPYFDYYNAKKLGNGTIADIVTRAFANMLSAAGKMSNVCVVVSDLFDSYNLGGRLIQKALDDAKQELGRQEKTITPVDLAANEIYEILRKRLFTKLPDKAEISDTANAFARKLEEATKSKTVNRGAEAIADEIAASYPFHPRLKNLIALFKENQGFKQTRGLIELISRLLLSVWERNANDVYLIGPQHFDLGIQIVRDKLVEISEMNDVIAKDLWDSEQSAHTQIISLQNGNDAAIQVGNLLFTASLSTAVNAVKGLAQEEIVECLLTPLREPSDFIDAFKELELSAWYLHHDQDGKRFYFDRQENLQKLLQSLAHDADETLIDDLIRSRLKEIFNPTSKEVYDAVLPLPEVDSVAESIRRGRVLLILEPEAEVPPAQAKKLFENVTQKNNLLILTGDKTAMGSLREAARNHLAAQKADSRIPSNHAQRKDLEKKQVTYDHSFTSAIMGLFDKVYFPYQRLGGDAELKHKKLEDARNSNESYDGEKQIQETLASDPIKFYPEAEKEFEAIRERIQMFLWPENQEEARWADVVDRYAEQPGMFWLTPKGLENVKTYACKRGMWEDLGNGYVTKNPKKKKTSVQTVNESEPDDSGMVRIRVSPMNAGPTPRIHYAEDGPVSESSPVLSDSHLSTRAFRVAFLVIDPSKQYETGEPTVWKNSLKIRNNLDESSIQRMVELFVAPSIDGKGEIRYTLNGSEARNGTVYSGPISIGDAAVKMLVFAEADGLETRNEFSFNPRGNKGVLIDPVKPCQIARDKAPFRLDSRGKAYECIQQSKDRSVTFQKLNLTIGQGSKLISIDIGEVEVSASFIEELLNKALEKFEPDVSVTMSFKEASFSSGHDLSEFKEKLGINFSQSELKQ